PVAQAHARGAIAELAAATGFPLLAEAASQLRFAGDGGPTPPEPALLADLEPPELIIQIGPPPTAAGYEKIKTPRVILPPQRRPRLDRRAPRHSHRRRRARRGGAGRRGAHRARRGLEKPRRRRRRAPPPRRRRRARRRRAHRGPRRPRRRRRAPPRRPARRRQ